MLDTTQISPVFLKQVKNTVDRILNVPGNYTKGKILEMTVVLDQNLQKKVISLLLPELLRTLKLHDKVFQNVRFHVVYWETEERPKDLVLPMTMAVVESFYEDYRQEIKKKSVSRLAKYLTLFHARSKLIILVTDGNFMEEEKEEVKKCMQPFLEKKMMTVLVKEGSLGQTPVVSYRE